MEKSLGPYSKSIKELIVERGRRILLYNGKCDDPNFVAGHLLYHITENLNVIRQIVDEDNHPWMLEHADRMAQYERENAPEDAQKKKYEQELLGSHYDTARRIVHRVGKQVFDFEWLIKELHSEQTNLLREIVDDENHKWMVDHLRAVREGDFIVG